MTLCRIFCSNELAFLWLIKPIREITPKKKTTNLQPKKEIGEIREKNITTFYQDSMFTSLMSKVTRYYTCNRNPDICFFFTKAKQIPEFLVQSKN